jgi:SulP family sulfate permease
MSRLTDLLPRRADYEDVARTWQADVVAGVSVAVVALPLALGFGVVSGMGASAGVVTAVIAGVVAAVLGGSHVQVSGPTGAMAVVLVPIVDRFGADAVFVVGLLAGAIVTAAAFARVGRFLAYIPWPVVEGFTVGIAAIIFLQQVPGALGLDRPDGENVAVVAVRALWRAPSGGDAAAVALVAVVAVLMIGLPRVRRSLPASLIAIGAATAVAEIAHLDVARIGALPAALPAPSLPTLGGAALGDLVGAAIAVAALAAIESLLSAKVADGMVDTKGHDPDRELLGQGVANLVTPLFGGMPATGAIARTAVNVRAGARTRVAATTHAAVLLALVLVGSGLVELVPLAALAGVLMVTAVRMVEPHNVRAVLRSTRADALVMVLTAASTIAFDLVVAIEIGVAVAALLALRSIARAASVERAVVEIDVEDEHRLLEHRIVTYRLDGALFFGAAQRFLTELTNVTDVDVVILRLPQVQVLDATGARALGEIVRELEDRGITVLLKGVSAGHERLLRSIGALAHLADERHLFDDLPTAVAHALEHAGRPRATAGGAVSEAPAST